MQQPRSRRPKWMDKRRAEVLSALWPPGALRELWRPFPRKRGARGSRAAWSPVLTVERVTRVAGTEARSTVGKGCVLTKPVSSEQRPRRVGRLTSGTGAKNPRASRYQDELAPMGHTKGRAPRRGAGRPGSPYNGSEFLPLSNAARDETLSLKAAKHVSSRRDTGPEDGNADRPARPVKTPAAGEPLLVETSNQFMSTAVVDSASPRPWGVGVHLGGVRAKAGVAKDADGSEKAGRTTHTPYNITGDRKVKGEKYSNGKTAGRWFQQTRPRKQRISS